MTVKFSKLFPKVCIATPIDVLCLNFVKFDKREISEIVRCLPYKNISLSLLGGSGQNQPGSALDNVLRAKAERAREHRKNAPYSKSNIPLKPVFDLNRNYFIL